jgi:hypothetical protein
MASVDLTFDVAVDVDSRRSRPQTFGIPPEVEGDTAGAYFFGEAADGTDGLPIFFEPVPGVDGRNADDAFQLLMGDDPASDGTSPLDGGAIVLTPGMSAGEAIAAINQALANIHSGTTDGFQVTLGPIAVEGDGSWTPGAVNLDDTTPVSEAIDRLNEVMGLLVPAKPPFFPNGVLSISNTAGASPLLCTGVVDRSGGGSGYAAASAVTRIATAGVSSFAFNDVGPGDAGTLQVLINGAMQTRHTLTGAGDNGSYFGLVIGDQKDFPPATPGFWKSVDVSLNLVAVPVGINKVQITDDAPGTTNTNTVFFVRDDMTANPAVSGGVVAEVNAGVLAYSSSVPHYGAGAQLHVDAAFTNLSGQTYYGGVGPFVISATNGILTGKTCTYADLGLTAPFAPEITAPTAIAQQTIAVDGTNVHSAGQVQGVARNVNGASAATLLSTKTLLVKRGSAGVRIDENSLTVSGLGAGVPGVRVALPTTDRPAGAAGAWDSAAALPAYEATVVGGVIKHDQTNYAVGFLPVGPNLSAGRLGDQYITFSFKRPALSVFKINITGNYDGCWVRLVGVSDNPAIAPNALNGWMDAMKSYDGAGVPGKAGDTAAGCGFGIPMNGANGAFTITFGTQSSTNATGNEIQVRIKLSPGEQITGLTFSN